MRKKEPTIVLGVPEQLQHPDDRLDHAGTAGLQDLPLKGDSVLDPVSVHAEAKGTFCQLECGYQSFVNIKIINKSLKQCFGSGSARIRIKIYLLDTDPHGQMQI